MKKIKNMQDLRDEKRRLKMEIEESELLLKEDFEMIKEELQPVRAIGRLFSKAMINKDHGLINSGVKLTIDTLVKNLLLAKSGWMVKLAVPFILKNLSSNYIAEKKPEVFGMLKNLIFKARKATNTSDHYDKSTADGMHYR